MFQNYSPQQPSLMDRHGFDSLGPAPYDPVWVQFILPLNEGYVRK